MTTETLSEDSLSQKPTELSFAGRMDSESRLLAKKLHDLGYIYVLFGALDGLSLSYSMVKYFFDMYLANSDLSSVDEMHNWMVSPEGAIIAATTSITLIVFAMLANHFSDNDKNAFKRYIALLWPYCRDIFKSLKNAGKGIISTLRVAELFGAGNLSSLFLPVGLLLGGLSVLNRLWLRWMVNKRKDMMKKNASLLAEIQNTRNLSLDRLDEIKEEIQKQSNSLRLMGMLSSAYGGAVDGLYLYMGVLGLSALSSPVLIAMTVFCSIYVLSCIATRMYEEYDYQRKLVISQIKIELAYEGKKIELLLIELQNIAQSISENPEDMALIAKRGLTISLFQIAVSEFTQKKKDLAELTTLSYFSAFLAGAKNGLAAYGALTSSIFAVGIILLLASVSFPPAVLITCIPLGMVFMIGFIAHSLVYAHKHRLEVERQQSKASPFTLPTSEMVEQPQNEETQPQIELAQLGEFFKQAKQEVTDLRPEEIRIALLDGTFVDSSPQFFFQEWFEVIRSFFSGVGKGAKAVDLTMNPLETIGSDGHYHESPIMLGFMVASAVLHAVVLGLRAHARGFGRPPIDQAPDKKIDDGDNELDERSDDTDEVRTDSNPSARKGRVPSPDSLPSRQRSLLGSDQTFFSTTKIKKSCSERDFTRWAEEQEATPTATPQEDEKLNKGLSKKSPRLFAHKPCSLSAGSKNGEGFLTPANRTQGVKKMTDLGAF